MFGVLAMVAAQASVAVEAEIPVEIEQNQVLISVTVGKSGPLTFLLDTGAQTTVIADDRLDAAGLSGGTAGSGTAQGGEIDTQNFVGVPVSVGGLPLGKIAIASVDLAGLSAGTGRHIDGILGYDFFRDRIVRIDYAARKVIVLRRGASLGPGLSLPIAVRGQTPFVDAYFRQGKATARGRLLLDTGAVGAVTLYADFLKAHPRLRPARSIALNAGAILPGQYVTRMGRIASVRSGPLLIRNPIANFSANPDADDAAPGDAGLIGGYVLSRYTVTIDYAGKRVVLAPGGRVGDAYDFDASGLSLTSDAAFSAKKVRLVLPDSPAALAGIMKGDQLVSVDGTPAAGLTLAKLRVMFRAIGTSYALRVRRGDREFDVILVMRRLI